MNPWGGLALQMLDRFQERKLNGLTRFDLTMNVVIRLFIGTFGVKPGMEVDLCFVKCFLGCEICRASQHLNKYIAILGIRRSKPRNEYRAEDQDGNRSGDDDLRQPPVHQSHLLRKITAAMAVTTNEYPRP